MMALKSDTSAYKKHTGIRQVGVLTELCMELGKENILYLFLTFYNLREQPCKFLTDSQEPAQQEGIVQSLSEQFSC